jgi:hypothetical protein
MNELAAAPALPAPVAALIDELAELRAAIQQRAADLLQQRGDR